MASSNIPQAISPEYEHSAYAEERRFWIDSEREQSLALDKSLLTLSAGAIGLTIILVTQYLPIHRTEVFLSLVASWIGYVGTILAVQYSQYWAQEASKAVVNELDVAFRRDDPIDARELRNALSARVTFRNRLARGFFLFAIIMTILFVILGIRAKEIANV